MGNSIMVDHLANPTELKRAQFEMPRLYEIPYELCSANDFAPMGRDSWTLEKEVKLGKFSEAPFLNVQKTFDRSRSKPHKPHPVKTSLVFMEIMLFTSVTGIRSL
ncbi:hypothetical protein Tco_0184406 [Tanacetum coccineum]